MRSLRVALCISDFSSCCRGAAMASVHQKRTTDALGSVHAEATGQHQAKSAQAAVDRHPCRQSAQSAAHDGWDEPDRSWQGGGHHLPASAEVRAWRQPLRKIRTLSAIDVVQGSRVHVVDSDEKRIGKTLAEALRPHAAQLSRFAATGRPYFSTAASDRWDDVFPMVVPPEGEDGLGIILLNSNTDSHFSFTNALGMISAAQANAMDTIFAQHSKACWLIGLHHHPVEYPRAAKVLSERIGTTLVNGNWFLRRLAPMAQRAILMHGHRHIDWIGECGALVIVSAPSPVMESKNDAGTYFYIHTLEVRAGNSLRRTKAERNLLNNSCVTRDAPEAYPDFKR